MQSMLEDQRNYGAYSTWFGKNFPVEFDICVLANILYFTQRYNIPWTKADSASLELIEKVVSEKKHITNPTDVSPYYSRTPKILYHLARLMSVKPIASLEKYKGQFIEEANTYLANKFSNPLKKWMRRVKLGKFTYECEGYNNVLLLEYWVWYNKNKKKI